MAEKSRALRPMRYRIHQRRYRQPARQMRSCALALCLLGMATSAQAQLALPPTVTETVRQTTDTLEPLRRDALPDLVSALERRLLAPLPESLPEHLNPPEEPLGALPLSLPILDAQGAIAFVDVEVEDGQRAVQQEWLIMLAPGEFAQLKTLDAEILERQGLPDVELEVVRFRVPPELDSYAALSNVLPAELVQRLDRNHIYDPQDGDSQPSARQVSNPVSLPSEPLCEHPLKIGMIDTAIATEHPGFADSRIIERDFLPEALGAEGRGQPKGHGTAVAGILVGTIEGAPARLPEATLYNASVFYSRNQYAEGATMMHLVSGLSWLAEQDVSVINMSLTGPDNRILAAAVASVTATGTVVVAAAGNEGPSAPALYPAAYGEVIASTAVDANGEAYRWANRGEHIDFAGPGVSIPTARGNGEYGTESGTSMAAPTVTAHAACALASQRTSAENVVRYLAGLAKDLGETGHDSIFGHGLLE